MTPNEDDGASFSSNTPLLPATNNFAASGAAPPEFGQSGFFKYYLNMTYAKLFVGDEHNAPLIDPYPHVDDDYIQLLTVENMALTAPIVSVLLTQLANTLRMYTNCMENLILLYGFLLTVHLILWVASLTCVHTLLVNRELSHREQFTKFAKTNYVIKLLRLVANIMASVQIILYIVYTHHKSSLRRTMQTITSSTS